LNEFFLDFLIFFNHFIFIIIPVILCVAFLTLTERKILAAIQRRKGPNVVGFFGFLQPFADGIKLVLKEVVLPIWSNKLLFFFAPFVTLCLSLSLWVIVPFSEEVLFVDLEYSVLYILSFSSLTVYGIIFSGWASNSRYAFLGALRSTAQMVSYEVSISLIYICLILVVGSLNLLDFVFTQEACWFIVPFAPLFLIYLISALAETNRPPFDLPEAEGELVAGYNVEYSAVGFALFFIAEYANLVFQSIIIVILFLGGWLPFISLELSSFIFTFKILLVLFFLIWVRGILPRYRYDQLMNLGWKAILPFTLAYVVFVSGIFFAFDWLPLTFI